jgi:hypothetical protein
MSQTTSLAVVFQKLELLVRLMLNGEGKKAEAANAD